MSTSGGSIGAAPPVAANVLSNGVTVAAAGSTTLLTIPAGRTWVGSVEAAIAAQNPPVTATGTAGARISTTGAGVTPAAGVPYVAADVILAATVAGALSGVNANESADTPNLVVVAPGGNAVTLSLDVSTAGTVTSLQARGVAVGQLQ